jgi:two-component system sensor histidine kinase/response regulator
VDTADNGAIAVQMAQAKAYDLVLMDMQMPEMDGLQATRALRNIAHLRALPIVAMTANAMQVDQDRCRDAGMVDFVSKPISPDVLWRVLLRWLRPRARAGATPAPRPPRPAAAPSIDALHQLRDVDTAAGLRRVLGREDLYLAQLRRFCTTYGTGLAPLQAALQGGDLAQAERWVHSLRGVAASIGSTQLPELAQTLEHGMRGGASAQALALLVQALEAPLAHLLDQLNALLPTEAPAAVLAQPTPEAPARRAQLGQLLRDSDASALQFMHEHEVALHSSLQDRFEAVRSAIDAFDFDGALAMLEAPP